MHELDPGPIEHPLPVAARAGAGAREPHALVQRGQHDGHIATVGVPEHPDSRALDALIGDQHGQPTSRIAEHGRYQQAAGHQPVGHLVEVLKPVVLTLVDTRAGVAAILEPDRIWREHHDPGARKRGPERLQRITRQPGNLALAQMPLAVVLMKHHHTRAAGMLGHQQQRWHLALIAGVADHLLDVPIPLPFSMDDQVRYGRDRETQQLSQTRAQPIRIHQEHSTGACSGGAPSSLRRPRPTLRFARSRRQTRTMSSSSDGEAASVCCQISATTPQVFSPMRR